MKMIAKSKSDYIRLVCHYRAKRKLVKEQFDFGDPAYKTAVKKINTKIGTYKNAIKRIDDWLKKLHSINDRIKYKYDSSVYKLQKHWSLKKKKSSVLWKMFCKYAVESGIPDLYVSQFIGWKKKRAFFYRNEFTKDMQIDMDYLNEWHNFKKGIERELPIQIRA